MNTKNWANDVLDLSHHNGDVNFDEVEEAGIRCVVLRTGDGKTPDRKFTTYATYALDADLDVALYHYNRADHPPELSEEIIRKSITWVRSHGAEPLFFAADPEGRPETSPTMEASGVWQDVDSDGKPATNAEVVEHVTGQLRFVKSLGVAPVLYAGRAMAYLDPSDRELLAHTADQRIWRAVGWRRMPVQTYMGADANLILHQYTNKAEVPGCPTPVDRNRRPGDTYAEWRKIFYRSEKPSTAIDLEKTLGIVRDIKTDLVSLRSIFQVRTNVIRASIDELLDSLTTERGGAS